MLFGPWDLEKANLDLNYNWLWRRCAKSTQYVLVMLEFSLILVEYNFLTFGKAAWQAHSIIFSFLIWFHTVQWIICSNFQEFRGQLPQLRRCFLAKNMRCMLAATNIRHWCHFYPQSQMWNERVETWIVHHFFHRKKFTRKQNGTKLSQ